MASSGERAASFEGLVTHKQLDRFEILVQGRSIPCRLSGALRHSAQRDFSKDKQSAGAVAVGDRVLVRSDSDATSVEEITGGLISEVLPRRNQLARRAAGKKPVQQVLAANLDLVVLVFAAAQPPPRWTMLDRFLVQAEEAEIQPLICITKADLVPPLSLEPDLIRYRDIGYPVVYTSVLPGETTDLMADSSARKRKETGLDELDEWLRGKVSVLVGKSGVGKSTLVNMLLGQRLATATVSSNTGKGRHTTSEARMIRLPQGGGIIDTPGLREFGLWRIPAGEVARHFREMRDLLDQCRFRSGCSHSHEPGCAVKEGVRTGRIHPERYRSFLRITGSVSDDDTEDEPAGLYNHSANNERRVQETAPSFPCANCGIIIQADALGTEHRNHCPHCLWSRHVDHRPGDRAAGCGGSMEPIAVSVRPDGEWTLLHRCRECGVIKSNRIAGDDNGALLLSMAARPLARPPFPLDRLPAVERR